MVPPLYDILRAKNSWQGTQMVRTASCFYQGDWDDVTERVMPWRKDLVVVTVKQENIAASCTFEMCH